MASPIHPQVVLGIDIGTSKVAVVMIPLEGDGVLASAAQPTHADIAGLPPGHSEQDVGKILEAVDVCIRALEPELRKRVVAIGLTGQMHGVLLWNSDYSRHSSLVTWQDRRVLHDGFLETLRDTTKETGARAGYGGSTLAWIARTDPACFERYDRASTIHDYLAALLCGDGQAKTDPSDAASWGFYDLQAGRWREDLSALAGVPKSILPEILPAGSMRGTVSGASAERWGIPAGTPVAVPLGDNQASLYGTLADPESEISLTYGTGAQISVIVSGNHPSLSELPMTSELRPFIGDRFAVVGASLCGGSAYKWIRTTLTGWLSELELPAISDDELYARIDSLALSASPSSLTVCTSFLGERHDPLLRGSISGVDLENFTLANLARAVVYDMVTNLRSMIPTALLEGKHVIKGSGNALRRSKALQRAVVEEFSIPLMLTEEREEAAIGAARVARRSHTV
jgi:sedoheptulokinase